MEPYASHTETQHVQNDVLGYITLVSCYFRGLHWQVLTITRESKRARSGMELLLTIVCDIHPRLYLTG